jgi:hypothetical protein
MSNITFTSPTQQLHPLRHRCRNVRCGGKLKAPADNPRDAFCCRGCFESYYRARCLACERPIDRRTERRNLCGRPKCKREFQRHPERFSGPRYPVSVLVPNASGSARNTGLKIDDETGRAFRKVAGPELSETSFRLAALPLDPELVARLDRRHAEVLEPLFKAKRRADRKAQIKHRHAPINVLGGYRFQGAPEIDLSPTDSPEWATASRWTPTSNGDDVEGIPNSLWRGALKALAQAA